MSIIIGADYIPQIINQVNIRTDIESNQEFDPALSGLFATNYSIINLETPLINQETPISKRGPVFHAPESTAERIGSLGINLTSIANNHILDEGETGLKRTIESLSKHSVECVGYQLAEGEKKPSRIIQLEKKIAVYACAENEFSTACNNMTGAEPFDPLQSFDIVRELKDSTDYVIVLFHGGLEEYQYPSPLQQKICRKFVESGADIVICNHSHCIGCMEKYKESVIVYGQGNFSFENQKHPLWNQGLLVKIDLSNDKRGDNRISFIPVSKKKGYTKMMAACESEAVLNGFQMRSEQISQEGFVERNFAYYSKHMSDYYICEMIGKNQKIWFRIFTHLFGNSFREKYIRYHMKKNVILTWIDFIRCESHRELLLKVLEQTKH